MNSRFHYQYFTHHRRCVNTNTISHPSVRSSGALSVSIFLLPSHFTHGLRVSSSLQIQVALTLVARYAFSTPFTDVSVIPYNMIQWLYILLLRSITWAILGTNHSVSSHTPPFATQSSWLNYDLYRTSSSLCHQFTVEATAIISLQFLASLFILLLSWRSYCLHFLISSSR